MRFFGWLCLVIGVGCLAAAGVLGILAIQQATEISAYQHARACPAGAQANANCLQTVDGSVAAVTEFGGGYHVSPDYALDVRTASTTLHLTFSSDSPMLGYAANGDPAVVTIWRGVPVSVATNGRSDVTTSVPRTELASHLGNGEVAGGLGAFLVLAFMGMLMKQRAGGTRASPALAVTVSALTLGGLVLVISGSALGGKPSRIGPDLAATGTALVVVLGLSAWLGSTVKRRAHPPIPHAAHEAGHQERTARPPLRARMQPVNVARGLGARAAGLLPVLLTVAVLFGVFLTSQDGPAARAFQHAPPCSGETNLDSCVGDFTAVINGVRAPANGASFADVSYVTSDDAINAWARLDGDAATIVRMASADENARTPLSIRVWRRSIVGAELGGGWHWAQGDPPGDTIPAVFLAVSFALLLLTVRMSIHRRAGSRASRRRLIIDDLGQAAAAAGSIVMLAYGFWPAAILALATLLWLGLSARRSSRSFG